MREREQWRGREREGVHNHINRTSIVLMMYQKV